MSTALQTMTDMMNLTPAQLKTQIDQLPLSIFIEGGKALIAFYRSEMKDLKAKRKDYCKGFDSIIKTAETILEKGENLTSEDRIYFFDSMKEANAQKVAILQQLDGKESLLKWSVGLVGLGTFIGIACAFIFGKKD